MARRILVALSLLVVIALALTLALRFRAPVGGRAVGAPTEELDYLAGPDGDELEVRVFLDRIGIVPRPGIGTEATDQLALDWGLEPAEVIGPLLGGEIRIFSTAGPRSRSDLQALVKEIRLASDEVEEAGLLLRLADDSLALLTGEIVISFSPDAQAAEIESSFAEHGLIVAEVSPFDENLFVVRLGEGENRDSLEITHELQEILGPEFVHPNAFLELRLFHWTPNDPKRAQQWHLANAAASGGLADADSDLYETAPGYGAWDISRGSSNTIIAVIDTAFEIGHEDLTDKIFINQAEKNGTAGVDDDGNGFKDDVTGWDFRNKDHTVGGDMIAGDYEPQAYHGTQVAGVAAAATNNSKGVAGACPECKILTIRMGGKSQAIADGFDYARTMGADVINTSWGLGTGQAKAFGTILLSIMRMPQGRNGRGLVWVAAVDNLHVETCKVGSDGKPTDFSIISSVILVGRTQRQDKWHQSAYGNCVDILAPGVELWTTDPTGKAPRNILGDYHSVTGTSYASPLTAGVAGLVLSVEPSLTRPEVHNLLQDTADKIETPIAAYSPATGFSLPKSGLSTHSWGRLNALEALEIVDPDGQAGRDILLRDHDFDWGNTESRLGSGTQFSSATLSLPWWTSPDIKIDSAPYSSTPTSSSDFDALKNERIVFGQQNRVYVRLRNRGPKPVEQVTVALYWTEAGLALPHLPGDIWTRFPQGSNQSSSPWKFAGARTQSNLLYSGSSVAGCPSRTTPTCRYGSSDDAQIVTFELRPPSQGGPPSRATSVSLLAIASSSQDKALPLRRFTGPADFVVANVVREDNNVALRNASAVDHGFEDGRTGRIWIRNPWEVPFVGRIRTDLMPDWSLSLGPGFPNPFELAPGEQILSDYSIEIEGSEQPGEILLALESLEGEVVGGFLISVQSEDWIEPLPLPDLVAFPDGAADIQAGQDVTEYLDLWIRNNGNAPADGTDERPGDGYRVALVLSSDERPPTELEPGESFHEDVMLGDGFSDDTLTLAPNETASYPLGGTIPWDTPPGDYCLGLLVDPLETVAESREDNNFSCHWIHVSGEE